MLINYAKVFSRRLFLCASQSTIASSRSFQRIHWLNCASLSKRNKCFICDSNRDALVSFQRLHFAVAVNGTTHERYFHSTTPSLSEIKTVVVPPFPESVSEGDVRWEKKAGDHVAEDDVVLEIETDKTSVQVPSPCHGVIEELLCQDGDTVKAGQELFRIKATGQAPQNTTSSSAVVTEPLKEVVPPAVSATPEISIAPKAQPKQPQALPTVTSTPSTPLLTKSAPKPERIETTSVKVPPADPTKEIAGTRSEYRIKMNRMRQRIAQRLKEAQNTNAMLTTFNEIDMSHIMAFRKKNLEQFQKKYGLKLGFMSAFIKASAYALQDQPVVNAVIDDQEIIYRDYVDVSVAVATPKGLVVPVLRNVEAMSYADIEIQLAALGEKARSGALTVEDMDGGTFTISNGGVFGSLMGTPIINPPQSSILGMHGIFERPVALNGQVVIRPMMYVALTYDHRLIDGREAVMFLRKIKAAVEDPLVILAGL